MIKGTTTDGEVYLQTIQSLKEALKLKRASSWRQKNLLLHDHKACNVQAVPDPRMWISELRHPPYSPDLASCDFFFVQKSLKKILRAENLPPIMS
jgi:hypothetical protein